MARIFQLLRYGLVLTLCLGSFYIHSQDFSSHLLRQEHRPKCVRGGGECREVSRVYLEQPLCVIIWISFLR